MSTSGSGGSTSVWPAAAHAGARLCQQHQHDQGAGARQRPRQGGSLSLASPPSVHCFCCSDHPPQPQGSFAPHTQSCPVQPSQVSVMQCQFVKTLLSTNQPVMLVGGWGVPVHLPARATAAGATCLFPSHSPAPAETAAVSCLCLSFSVSPHHQAGSRGVLWAELQRSVGRWLLGRPASSFSVPLAGTAASPCPSVSSGRIVQAGQQPAGVFHGAVVLINTSCFGFCGGNCFASCAAAGLLGLLAGLLGQEH